MTRAATSPSIITSGARRRSVALLVAAVAAVAALGAAIAAPPASAAGRTAVNGFTRACPPATGMQATCFARYRATAAGLRGPRLTPADIAAAYQLPASRPGSLTVGVVDAMNDPKAEHDLAVYRKHFGLPPCTTANGCFHQVNEHGGSRVLPQGDPGWGVEISLDLDAVSAACPGCHIVLVEGFSPDIRDLGKAENTAVAFGADVVSNSYGLDEFNGMSQVGQRYYTHAHIPIVVSSGDYGFGLPQFPAVLHRSIAVGGTSLRKAKTPRGWREAAWWGAGSGCSGYVPKPAWQTDTHCPMRMVADVSAVADLDSGFLVYDTFGLGRQNGFVQVGGTSLSAPLIAGMIARAGNPRQLGTAQYIYQHPRALHDVRGGSNGFCGRDYLCGGKQGYDGPTGAGSPHGLGAL